MIRASLASLFRKAAEWLEGERRARAVPVPTESESEVVGVEVPVEARAMLADDVPTVREKAPEEDPPLAGSLAHRRRSAR